jgi:DNA-binding transcriptional LysR family regulator
MEMQQIRYFLSLAETLNFTRAADACNVSQPALTRAIQALEAELGGELIRRERANTHLTALGQHMLPLMQRCFDAAHSARSLARAVQSSDVAPLTLAVSRSINFAAFVRPIAELFRAFPGAQLRLRRGAAAQITAMLRAGEVDFALAGDLDDEWDRLDSIPLFTEPLRLAVYRDHRLANQSTVSLRQLSGERFLSLAGCETAAALVTYLASHGVEHMTTHEVDSANDLTALLETSSGICLLPASAAVGPGIVCPALSDAPLRRTVYAHVVAGRQRAPVACTALALLRAADWGEYEG